MLSARQLLLMRRARDRTIGVAIAPIRTDALLPDPDFRRRVLSCVSHVGLSRVARWVGRMDRISRVSVNFSATRALKWEIAHGASHATEKCPNPLPRWRRGDALPSLELPRRVMGRQLLATHFDRVGVDQHEGK